MAELTSQDRENYTELKTAFNALHTRYQADCSIPVPIQGITQSANDRLLEVDKLNNDTGELRERVDLIDGYFKFHALLLPNNSEDVQEIKNLNEELNRSLKVVEDETVDLTEEIESFSADHLFLEFLPLDNFKKWTEALLSERDPKLDETQINQLIQTWGKSVQKFVEDARKKGDPLGKVTPGESETFASFFSIHNELETLYSRLADTETVQGSR